MSLPVHTLKAALATAISLWMTVVACFMGCTLPALANPSSTGAAAIQKNSADQSQTDQMAGMENCPHHSGGSVPAKPNDGKPVRSAAMSCCPLEITVALK